MKLLLFVVGLPFLAIAVAQAECVTKEKLDEEQNYIGCTITQDGTTREEKITDSACASFCQLQKAKNRNDTYREFTQFKKITPKPGELKPAPTKDSD